MKTEKNKWNLSAIAFKVNSIQKIYIYKNINNTYESKPSNSIQLNLNYNGFVKAFFTSDLNI